MSDEADTEPLPPYREHTHSLEALAHANAVLDRALGAPRRLDGWDR